MESIAFLAPKHVSHLSLQPRPNNVFPTSKLITRFPLITSFPCKPAKLIPLKAKTNLICDHNQEINRKYKKLPLSEWTHRFHSVNIDVSEMDALRREIDELKPRVKNTLMSYQSKKRILMIYLLVSLGVAYHFEDEIDEILKNGFEKIEEMMAGEDDLYTVSIIFYVFRTYGHNISAGIFNRFKDETGKFKQCLVGDAKGLLSLYEAAHLGTTKDYILDEALNFTKEHLKSLATSTISGPCLPHLSKHIQNALAQPQHWNMEILVAMEYIPFYEQEEDRDERLLKFAKLNFKLAQLSYLEELKTLTKWYKELGLAYMLPPYFRDRIVELHFYAISMYYKPQLSYARIILTQYFVALIILDDTCDRYASLTEAESFAKSVERWGPDSSMEKQPDYLKFVFNFIMDTFKEFERELQSDGRCYNVKATIDEIKLLMKANRELAKWAEAGDVPSLEDYMEVANTEITTPTTLAGAFMGMGESSLKEAYEWLKARPKIIRSLSTKARLLNDLTGFKDDMKRGYVTNAVCCYMKQYGVTEEETFKELYKMVADCDKSVNEEFLKTTCVLPRWIPKAAIDVSRMANVCYNVIEGLTNPQGKIKEYMTSLFLNLIHL